MTETKRQSLARSELLKLAFGHADQARESDRGQQAPRATCSFGMTTVLAVPFMRKRLSGAQMRGWQRIVEDARAFLSHDCPNRDGGGRQYESQGFRRR